MYVCNKFQIMQKISSIMANDKQLYMVALKLSEGPCKSKQNYYVDPHNAIPIKKKTW